MKLGSVTTLIAGLLCWSAVHATEVFLPADDLTIESFVPLAELTSQTPQPVPRAVDPFAIYSNVTGFSGQAFAQGAASGGITRLVMDDVTFTTNAGVSAVTSVRFAVANLNAASHSVRARLRFWNADGAPLGSGLANGPGTYFAPGGTPVGFSFNPVTFGAGVTTVTGNLGVGFPVPADATTTLWAGITFDNVGTTTGATDAELNNFGQAMFAPVDLGSSSDTLFATTAPGSFFPTANPTGAALAFAGAPVANQGWEFIVTALGANSADLAITKADGVTTAVPGESVTYTIVASNAGPNNAPASTVTDTFPTSLTCTWTCVGAGGATCAAAGSGDISDTVNLPINGNVTYTANCAIAANASGSLSNTALVAATGAVSDPTPGNNSATDIDVLAPEANLSITKTDGVSSVVPGTSLIYTIVASNAGPSDSPFSAISDNFPAGLSCIWTCLGAGGGSCTAAGSGNIADNANLPASGSVTYTASCSVSSSLTGSLINTATATSTCAPPVLGGCSGPVDPNPADNSATDTDALTAEVDLSITKTDGLTTVLAGGPVTYTIVASNAGPSDAPGTLVNDLFASSLTCNWTCTGSGGGLCPASGSGNINAVVSLPAMANVTFSATCNIAVSAVGTLSNTASVSPSGSIADTNGSNNSATDDTALLTPANVSGTKSAAGFFIPGGNVVYTIVLTNAGFGAQADNPGDELVDVLPTQLTLVSASATSGIAVAQVGTNTVTWNGAIAANSSVTITINASIPTSTLGTVSNQASISFDADANNSNESSRLTDDPSNPATADPTLIVVLPPSEPIPTLNWIGLVLLSGLIAGFAMRRHFV